MGASWGELRERLGSDCSVALLVVGAIPYATAWQTIAMLGLKDDHIARTAARRGGYSGHERYDSDYVVERSPDLVLVLPTIWQQETSDARVVSLVWGPANKDLLNNTTFRRRYRFDWVSVRSGVVPVYRRRDFKLPPRS